MLVMKRRQRLQRMFDLIGRKATGRPEVFAKRLDVSESTVYRDLEWFRQVGYALRYNYAKETYEFMEVETAEAVGTIQVASQMLKELS